MAMSDIKTFLDATRDRRLGVAHIQGAHGSGKSTRAVPAIWLNLHGDPSIAMVYIQATEGQTALLRSYLTESGDSTIAGGIRDERLQLWSFTTAVAKLLKGYEALDGNTVVCLDLDVAPTAYGEFLLACLIERAMQVHSAGDDRNRLVLFTLGAGAHRYPAIEPFTDLTVIEFGVQRQMPEPIKCDPDRLASPIMRIVGSMTAGGRGLVLTFLSDYESRVAIRSAMGKAFSLPDMPAFKEYSLKPAHMNDPAYLETLMRIEGYALIQIDPSITTRVPFRDVHAVFYSLESPTKVLDSYTGLYLWKEKLTSQPEIDVYRSYTASVDNQRSEAIVLAAVTSKIVDVLQTPRSRAYDSELPVTVLLAFSKWQCRVNEMPLARLSRPVGIKWLEGAYLLKSMGMLTKANDCWVPTAQGTLATSWLSYTHDWRLACFLGHISPKLTVLAKRVMIRLAAIIEHKVPLDLRCTMSPSLMRAIVATSCGPAASMVDYGDLWVALSIWESARRQSNNFSQPGPCVVLGNNVELRLGKSFYGRVLALEKVSDLPPETAAEMAMTLDANQLRWIEQALADAWASSLFWIGRSQAPGEIYARCFAHGDQILVNTENEAICFDGLLNNGGCLATALDIRFADDQLEAVSTILLDNRCVKRIYDRMGKEGRICDTFGSFYAHHCRVEK
ncbi:hypothetical protein B0I37DRAFT_387495 [Chaetomium sp. MPI-CAGE-AT-0009]|nr:hypothetical protein B0I37DRAFT_387495 [Chaetomium sp. MPI-CAGE-AT-0009]